MRTEVQDFNKDLFLQLNNWSCAEQPIPEKHEELKK